VLNDLIVPAAVAVSDGCWNKVRLESQRRALWCGSWMFLNHGSWLVAVCLSVFMFFLLPSISFYFISRRSTIMSTEHSPSWEVGRHSAG